MASIFWFSKLNLCINGTVKLSLLRQLEILCSSSSHKIRFLMSTLPSKQIAKEKLRLFIAIKINKKLINKAIKWIKN